MYDTSQKLDSEYIRYLFDLYIYNKNLIKIPSLLLIIYSNNLIETILQGWTTSLNLVDILMYAPLNELHIHHIPTPLQSHSFNCTNITWPSSKCHNFVRLIQLTIQCSCYSNLLWPFSPTKNYLQRLFLNEKQLFMLSIY